MMINMTVAIVKKLNRKLVYLQLLHHSTVFLLVLALLCSTLQLLKFFLMTQSLTIALFTLILLYLLLCLQLITLLNFSKNQTVPIGWLC